MDVADIVDGEPDKASVAVQSDVAHSRAVEETLRDPVIESLPLDLYGDDPLFVCMILNLRIFYRDVVQIVF